MDTDLVMTVLVNMLIFLFTARLFWRLFSNHLEQAGWHGAEPTPLGRPAAPVAEPLPRVQYLDKRKGGVLLRFPARCTLPATVGAQRVPVSEGAVLRFQVLRPAVYTPNAMYTMSAPLFSALGVDCSCEELNLIN